MLHCLLCVPQGAFVTLVAAVISGLGSVPASGQGLVERVEVLEKVLQNAIVVTPHPCSDLGGGWQPYAYGQGRFLMGTGGAVTGLPGGIGGTSAIKIDLEHMPRHRHTVTSVPPSHPRGVSLHDGFGGSGESHGISDVYDSSVEPVPNWSVTQHDQFMSTSGGDQTLNHLPPYVLVNFCQFNS